MLSLREQAQICLRHYRKQASNTPKIEDVVLLKNKLPPGTGKILELIKAIRAAKVLVSPDIVLQRALNILHPIEYPEDQTIVSKEEHVDTTGQEESTVTDDEAELD